MKGKLVVTQRNCMHIANSYVALILVGGFGTRLRPLVRLPQILN